MNKFKLSLLSLLLIVTLQSSAFAQSSPPLGTTAPTLARTVESTTVDGPAVDGPTVVGLISACDKAADELMAARALIAAQQREISLLRQREQLADERLKLECALRNMRERELNEMRTAVENYQVRVAELEIQLDNKQVEIVELEKRLAVAKRTTKLAAIGGFIVGVFLRLR